MKILEDGRIQCRVRIEGRYKGEYFTYTDPIGEDGSQFIWPREPEFGDTEKDINDKRASRSWWEDGNMGCDCNRSRYLPEHLLKIHGGDCDHEIELHTITPIEGDNLPTLTLTDELTEEDDIEIIKQRILNPPNGKEIDL